MLKKFIRGCLNLCCFRSLNSFTLPHNRTSILMMGKYINTILRLPWQTINTTRNNIGFFFKKITTDILEIFV